MRHLFSQLNLKAALRVPSGADLLINPVKSTLGAHLAQQLEWEVWLLVQNLIEHVDKFGERRTDGRIEDLWELAEA